jgi:hypothetical protein
VTILPLFFAYQLTNILGDVPMLYPSDRKYEPKYWRLSWLVVFDPGPRVDHHCWRNSPDYELLPKVAKHSRGTRLPLVLPEPGIGGGWKNEVRPNSGQPISDQIVTRRQERHRHCVSEARNAMKIAGLIYIRIGIQHLENGPTDQIPVFW